MEVGADTRQIRIVISDEHSLFRDAIRATLEREPQISVVGAAADAQEAIAEVDRHRPDIAILTAAGSNGSCIEATKAIRERFPDTKVVVVGEYDDQSMLVEAFLAGASGYLTKTCALQDLIQAAQSVASNRTYVTQKMLRVLVEQMVRNGQQRHDNLRRLARLTPREREVLFELSMGADNESIAKRFFISPQTARTHIQNLLTKLGLHSRLAAASFAMQAGVAEILDDLQTATSASDRSSTATRELDPSARKPNSPITGGMAETTARGS